MSYTQSLSNSKILIDDGTIDNRGTQRNRESEIKDKGFSSQNVNTFSMLIDLFFFCRKRLDQNSLDDLTKVIPLDCEKEEIEIVEISLLLEYIKQVINYLVKSKIQLDQKLQQLAKPEEECMHEYEGMLQKLEAECRNHIRYEQQLVIAAETAQENQVTSEKNIANLKKEQQDLIRMIDEQKRRVSELQKIMNESNLLNDELRGEIDKLNIIKAEQEDKISQLEHKVREFEEAGKNSASIYGKIQRATKKDQDEQSNYCLSSSENSLKKQQGPSSASLQKRTVRSVSSMNPAGVIQDEGSQAAAYREVMKQLENNTIDKLSSDSHKSGNNMRVKTEPFQQNIMNNNFLKVQQSQNNNPNYSYLNNAPLQNTYSQDALAYLLGTSQMKSSSSHASYNNNKSSQETKKMFDKYLLEKDGGVKRISGEIKKQRPHLDLNKSSKGISASSAINISHNSQNSANGSKGQGGKTASQNQQALLIKTIQQQQIVQQVQSQAILNRIHQKIAGSQSQASQQPVQQKSNTSFGGQGSSKNSNGIAQVLGQTQRPLSRSKSRTKIRDGGSIPIDNQKIKEYNMYSINPSTFHLQKHKGSPGKQKFESNRSHSVDTCNKLNNSKSNSKV